MKSQKLALLLTTSFFAISAYSMEEKQITLDDVPPQVMATAVAAAGGADISKVGLDFDGGVATYEFEAKNSNGRMLEVDVTDDGRVEEIEHQINLNEVPNLPMNLVKRYLPDFKPSFIEKSTRGNFEVWYELEGMHNNTEIDVEVDHAGKQIVINDDQAG